MTRDELELALVDAYIAGFCEAMEQLESVLAVSPRARRRLWRRLWKSSDR